MPLSDYAMVDWSRSASEWYGGERASARPVPEGLRQFDVEYASDVSSLIPILYYVARFSWGAFQPPPITCIEIGTADGSSALPVLKAIGEIGGHLHSVDPADCLDAARLVDQFGYRAHWTHHKQASDHFFETFNSPVDFAFIDGDHRWPVVERDVLNTYARLRAGGIIWVSDYAPLPKGMSFEHEYDGRPFATHIGQDPVGDKQMEFGIAKALRRAAPKLVDAHVFHVPIWPNPSVLIRKLPPSEAI